MSRFVLVVSTTLAVATLYAWYMKGDLEMAWLAIGPLIVGGTVLLALMLAWLLLPAGFPRAGAALAAFPFGVLLAWAAMFTPNHWRVSPEPARIAAAQAIAADADRVQASARAALGMPIELAAATVDTTPGAKTKRSGRLGLETRPAAVRVNASFAVGPYGVATFDVARADSGWALTPAGLPPEHDRIHVRPVAFTRRYPDVALVEVGGPDPFASGALVPVRLLQAEDDWSIEILAVIGEDEPLTVEGRLERAAIEARIRSVVAARGHDVDRIVTYFRPAGTRVLYMAAPAFDFQALLRGGGFAQVQAQLEGDSIAFTVGPIRGTTGRARGGERPGYGPGR